MVSQPLNRDGILFSFSSGVSGQACWWVWQYDDVADQVIWGRDDGHWWHCMRKGEMRNAENRIQSPYQIYYSIIIRRTVLLFFRARTLYPYTVNFLQPNAYIIVHYVAELPFFAFAAADPSKVRTSVLLTPRNKALRTTNNNRFLRPSGRLPTLSMMNVLLPTHRAEHFPRPHNLCNNALHSCCRCCCHW